MPRPGALWRAVTTDQHGNGTGTRRDTAREDARHSPASRRIRTQSPLAHLLASHHVRAPGAAVAVAVAVHEPSLSCGVGIHPIRETLLAIRGGRARGLATAAGIWSGPLSRYARGPWGHACAGGRPRTPRAHKCARRRRDVAAVLPRSMSMPCARGC